MPLYLSKNGFTNRQLQYLSKIIPSVDWDHIYDEATVLNKIKENANALTSRAAFNSFNRINENESPAKEIHRIIDCNFLDLKHFEWIDTKNERLCNYVWSYIRLLKSPDGSNINQISKDDVFNSKKPSNSTLFSFLENNYLYDNFKLDPIPNNSKAKKELIILFIDMVNDSLEIKIKALNYLREKWMLSSEICDVMNWIEIKNQDWAWNYLHNSRNPIWFSDNGAINNHLNGIITTFDLLNDTGDTRTLLFSKMKLAWAQKSYRDKNNGKKSVNIVLSEEIIRKLNQICESTDRRKNEVVTRLIRDEFEKIQKGGH